jgi:hypothetical protein
MSRERWEHLRDDTEWFIELGQLGELARQTDYLRDIRAFQAAQYAESQRIQQLPRCPDCAVPLELGVRKCRACHGMLIWLQVDSEVLPISHENREESLARISDHKMSMFRDARDFFIRVSRQALPELRDKLQSFQTCVERKFGTLHNGQEASNRIGQTENNIFQLKAQIDREAHWYQSVSGTCLAGFGMMVGFLFFTVIPTYLIGTHLPNGEEHGRDEYVFLYVITFLILVIAGPFLGFFLIDYLTQTLFGRRRQLKLSLRKYQAEIDQDDTAFLDATRDAFNALNNLKNAFQELHRRWRSHRQVVKFALDHDVVLQALDFRQASLEIPVNPFDPKALEMLVQIGHNFGIEFPSNATERYIRNLSQKPTGIRSRNEIQDEYSESTNHPTGLIGHQTSAMASGKLKGLCPGCATRFTLSGKLLGRKVKCKMCSLTFDVPGRASVASESKSIVIACPACDTSLQLTGDKFGKLIRCPKCSSTFRTPG